MIFNTKPVLQLLELLLFVILECLRFFSAIEGELLVTLLNVNGRLQVVNRAHNTCHLNDKGPQLSDVLLYYLILLLWRLPEVVVIFFLGALLSIIVLSHTLLEALTITVPI